MEYTYPAHYSDANQESYSSVSVPTLTKYAAPKIHYYSFPTIHSNADPAINSYASPVVAKEAEPVIHKTISEQYAPTYYDFKYSVHDPHTQDIKSQKEVRPATMNMEATLSSKLMVPDVW